MLPRLPAFLVLSLLTILAAIGRGADDSKPIRVMSFNIRYGTAADGENHWEKRRDFVVQTIRDFQPDLLGTQETLGFQRDHLAEQLPGMAAFAAGRDDGKEQGEMSALFYRNDRFERLEGGHFWLSETPEQAGSKSWDSALPRMVTWVLLRDRQQSAAHPILFLNTHFDHRGTTARIEAARLLRQRVGEMGAERSVIVTGDFNAPEGSAPYRTLFSAELAEAARLTDTYRQVHAERGGEEGTFSNFQAGQTQGPRIDWIGVSADWQIVAADIDRTARDGRTPSDHFPVTAVVRRNRSAAR